MVTVPPTPFSAFLGPLPARSTPGRAVITAMYDVPEPLAVQPLLARAELPAPLAVQARACAVQLVEAMRRKGVRGAVQGLVREYDLSSEEGVALMCLAEALLRIPDRATRDALIRDKIGRGDWRAHLGRGASLFVNAATWGLVVSGRVLGTIDQAGLAGALNRLIARGGEPLIRGGVDVAMRILGEQFVTGQTIAEALRNSRALEARGFRYSYDMLGEAAATADDAARYFRDYETAIHAIGKAASGRGIYNGPGISIKLSALHPRYVRAQHGRVMTELLPRVAELARLARGYAIGLNIDAEESERLDLSLDIVEALCELSDLSGWDGLGLVVQAYQKRAPAVLDWLIALARRTSRRIMVRLVKGAYWDSEIKRAQVEGVADYPVYTRKAHTDVAYLACANTMLGARDALFPQFATHNAASLAAIHALAGANFCVGDYEFQCLHGMGETLYDEVVGADRLDRPCRIYAPVGTHETLLAYLVRRLLENGANSSFVNRIQDPSVPVDDLVADPVALVRAEPVPGARHPSIVLPRDLFGDGRANARGLNIADERVLADLETRFSMAFVARQDVVSDGEPDGASRRVLNPADHTDVVGSTVDADEGAVARAITRGDVAAPLWA
ncbi:proline dehydrogenase family protein, partial [Ameyamaea chiangmaiensis]